MICVDCRKAADYQRAFLDEIDDSVPGRQREVSKSDIKAIPEMKHPKKCKCDCQHGRAGTVQFAKG